MDPPDKKRDIHWGDAVVFDDNGEPLSPAARRGLSPLDPPPGKRWADVLDYDLDYCSLADAYFERARGTTAERAYWQRKVELLEEFLGVALDPGKAAPSWEERCGALRMLQPADGSNRANADWLARQTSSQTVAREVCEIAFRAVRLHGAISSPLNTRQLEGLPHPFVGELQQKHRRTFVELDDALRAACRAVVADALRILEPEVVRRRVRMTQLFDRGLEWWPPDDEDIFF